MEALRALFERMVQFPPRGQVTVQHVIARIVAQRNRIDSPANPHKIDRGHPLYVVQFPFCHLDIGSPDANLLHLVFIDSLRPVDLAARKPGTAKSRRDTSESLSVTRKTPPLRKHGSEAVFFVVARYQVPSADTNTPSFRISAIGADSLSASP